MLDESLISVDEGQQHETTTEPLPFIIKARANGTTEAIFQAVRAGDVVSLVKHRIGNQRRREEIAIAWSEDERLRNGIPLDAATIAREIERIEVEVLAVIDEPDDEPLPVAGPSEEKEKGPGQSELLVRLALDHYRIGRTPDDEPFAVLRNGPNVALMFRGSRDALRCSLARLYRQEAGKTPSTNALCEAMMVLQGEAMVASPEPVHLRVARHGANIVIDLGDVHGRAVVVRPGSWDVHDASPVLFRRTGLTLPLPTPERGGNLDVLKALLNVSRSSWPLLRAWLVAALIPDIAYGIVLLVGLQGTGKSVAARLLATLIDPSSAVLRCEPRDLEQWAVSASASIVVAVDNISAIYSWWSDALCRAVSGDGMIRRRLYSDGDLTVLQFRRVVLLTSIDPGSLRGDLADRILSIELDRIPDDRRRLESEIMERFEAEHGHLFGAVLDLLANVLEVLPSIRLDSMPRLADFARVLAAIDTVDGVRGRDGSALELFMGQRGSLSADVIDSDAVGGAVVRLMEGREEFKGTAGDLLAALTPTEGRSPKHWPENPRTMAARVKRLIPALRGVGIEVSHNRDRRTYSIARETTQADPHQKEAHPTAHTAHNAQKWLGAIENADSECAIECAVARSEVAQCATLDLGCAVAQSPLSDRAPDRAPENGIGAIGNDDSARLRGMRGPPQTPLMRDKDGLNGGVANLSPSERESFEGRAACFEADGVPRHVAERKALASLGMDRTLLCGDG